MRYILVVVLLLVSLLPPASASFTVDFEFTDTEGDLRSISEFQGKPVLIEWAASWCTVCKRNQQAINEIYEDYKDDVTFISISILVGDDTLEDVQEMKESRGYTWLFGLETTDYSSSNGALNGYSWLLNSDLEVLRTWNSTIVTPEELGGAFEEELGIENRVEASSLAFPFLPALVALVLIRRRH
ncbi:MAG: peroxiredoxin family protein [Candidatus Kariarchaeaceae archaeon]